MTGTVRTLLRCAWKPGEARAEGSSVLTTPVMADDVTESSSCCKPVKRPNIFKLDAKLNK